MGVNVKELKSKIRFEIWEKLERFNVARYPLPLEGRIPNFDGSDKAAMLVRKLNVWKNAKVVFSNPDYAQKKVREFALKDGKSLITATPELKHGFLLVKPEDVKGLEDKASTIRGLFTYGLTINLENMPKPDLIVTGCVAVDEEGFRLGKGGGYGDREIGIIHEKFGYVPVITTVHELQIVKKLPREKHDTKVDFIVTPSKIYDVNNKSWLTY
ncbi:MAG: 5-formyltetrahydrofolate cyclo-ligase [Candidatus Bathyarchaeota archaeon]